VRTQRHLETRTPEVTAGQGVSGAVVGMRVYEAGWGMIAAPEQFSRVRVHTSAHHCSGFLILFLLWRGRCHFGHLTLSHTLMYIAMGDLDSYSSAGVYAVVRKIGYPTHTRALFFIETGKV
jgi:hypothetical protein